MVVGSDAACVEDWLCDGSCSVPIGSWAGENRTQPTAYRTTQAGAYGNRFGTTAADGFSDIMIGGAIVLSLLHRDPQYFYQGTGTTGSWVRHVMFSPFVAKADNGKWQPSYSSAGGDLASSALANLYYPNPIVKPDWCSEASRCRRLREHRRWSQNGHSIRPLGRLQTSSHGCVHRPDWADAEPEEVAAGTRTPTIQELIPGLFGRPRARDKDIHESLGALLPVRTR